VAGEQANSNASVRTMLSAIKALLPDVGDDDIMNLELLVQRSDDPVVLATLIAALIEERRRTNALLKEIRDALAAFQPPSFAPPKTEELGLSEADEKILALVRDRGMVCAEDVRDALGYKGLNAASARLNGLYRRGLVRKVRKGRKVYYAPA
jgi:DNA-binding transcriptional ArsR family regulator